LLSRSTSPIYILLDPSVLAHSALRPQLQSLRRRDFIVEVIGKPVVVVGNSIGGFVGTSMAADNPSIVSHD